MGSYSKCSIDTQTKKVTCVIRKNKILDISILINWLESNTERYVLMPHIDDVNPITKLKEGPHYHFTFDLKQKGIRLSTTLNNICRLYNFKDTNGVEIDKYSSFVACTQYLTHQNESFKNQHSIDEIITNVSREELTTYLNSSSDVYFNFDMLYSICSRRSATVMDLLKEIPPKVFKLNYYYIKTMWNYIHNGDNKL